MQEKPYALLIFPGLRGKLHKVRLPRYTVHLVLVFSVVAIVTLAGLANSYARMLLKISNYNYLRTEREALKSKYRNLENRVEQANARLGSLETLAAEVALTYGLGEAGRLRFPHSLLNITIQKNSSSDTSYHASLYMFNFMSRAARNPSADLATAALFSDLRLDHSVIPSIWPVQGQVTAGFGQRLDPLSGEGAFHAGLDISAPLGTRVEAAADGIVFYAGAEAGYGNTVLVDHGYGITTKYGHLSRISVLVGQEVKRGQIIGAVGMTGKTTGPHLHYEVHVHETPVNPAKYLRG